MRPADLRKHCLSFPGATETFPFAPDTSVFKVEGKMFALSALARRPLSVSLKCEPALAEQLRQMHEAVTPGYHLNKKHWNTVAQKVHALGGGSQLVELSWSRSPGARRVRPRARSSEGWS